MSAEEREFAAYLQRRSLVTPHGYEHAEPPAELDQEVLRAAHDAVAASSTRRLPLTRWAVPGAIAAAMLVSLAFMMHAGMQRPTASPMSSTARIQPQPAREPVPAAALDGAPSPTTVNAVPPAALNAPHAPDATNAPRTPDALHADSYRAALNGAPSARGQPMQKPAQVESDPRAWLAHIEALRAQGQQQQADAQLQRLRAAFPDFRIDGLENTGAAAKRAAPASRTPKQGVDLQ